MSKPSRKTKKSLDKFNERFTSMTSEQIEKSTNRALIPHISNPKELELDLSTGNLISMLEGCPPDLSDPTKTFYADPTYQRWFSFVRKTIQKYIEDYIKYKARGFDKILLSKVRTSTGKCVYAIVNGQHRLTWKNIFFNGIKKNPKSGKVTYPIKLSVPCIIEIHQPGIDGEVDIGGLNWGEILAKAREEENASLPIEQKPWTALVKQTSLITPDFDIFVNYSEELVCERYEATNESSSLSAQEKRSAIYGVYSNVIKTLAREDYPEDFWESGFKFHKFFRFHYGELNVIGRPILSHKWTEMDVDKFHLEHVLDTLICLEPNLGKFKKETNTITASSWNIGKEALDALHKDNQHELSDEVKKNIKSVLEVLDALHLMASHDEDPKFTNPETRNPTMIGTGSKADFFLVYLLVRKLLNLNFQSYKTGVWTKYKVVRGSILSRFIGLMLVGKYYNPTERYNCDIREGEEAPPVNPKHKVKSGLPLLTAYNQATEGLESLKKLYTKEEEEIVNSFCIKHGLLTSIDPTERGIDGETSYHYTLRGGNGYNDVDNYNIAIERWNRDFFPLLLKMSDEELLKYVGIKREPTRNISDEDKATVMILTGHIDTATGESSPSSEMVMAHINPHKDNNPATVCNLVPMNSKSNLKQGSCPIV